MKKHRMGSGPQLLLCLVVVAGVPGWGVAQDAGPGPGVQAYQLRKQQVEVLERALKQEEERHRAGQAGIVELTPLRKELLAARLGMQKGLAEQVALLEAEIEEAKKLEAIMKAKFEMGMVTDSEVLLAKAYRLGVEIRLADIKAAAERRRGSAGERVRRRVLPSRPSEPK